MSKNNNGTIRRQNPETGTWNNMAARAASHNVTFQSHMNNQWHSNGSLRKSLLQPERREGFLEGEHTIKNEHAAESLQLLKKSFNLLTQTYREGALPVFRSSRYMCTCVCVCCCCAPDHVKWKEAVCKCQFCPLKWFLFSPLCSDLKHSLTVSWLFLPLSGRSNTAVSVHRVNAYVSCHVLNAHDSLWIKTVFSHCSLDHRLGLLDKTLF